MVQLMDVKKPEEIKKVVENKRTKNLCPRCKNPKHPVVGNELCVICFNDFK